MSNRSSEKEVPPAELVATPEGDARKRVRVIDPSLQECAEALLNLLESDFGQSGEDVRLKAIFLELESAYLMGRRHERDK